MAGFFITFEGVEGCGKSTQIKLLADKLTTQGRDLVLTREPGGTPIADQIRAILLDGKNKEMTALTELLLYASSRAEHLGQVVTSALAQNKTVLCDRFIDSTTAYQGYARGFELTLIEQIHHIACQGLKPDLTLLLDMDPELGIQRALSRMADTENKEDRFEQEHLDFHKKVRAGFLEIAQQNQDRFVIVDANQSIEKIHQEIIKTVEERLK